MAEDIARQFHEDDKTVPTVTTDNDTRVFLGFQNFYDKLGIAWDVRRQADPKPLCSTQDNTGQKKPPEVSDYFQRNRTERLDYQSLALPTTGATNHWRLCKGHKIALLSHY